MTSDDQTTIPESVREALHVKPGDRLEYLLDGDRVSIRVHPSARSFSGALAGHEGKGMSFAEIREAAARIAVEKNEGRW